MSNSGWSLVITVILVGAVAVPLVVSEVRAALRRRAQRNGRPP